MTERTITCPDQEKRCNISLVWKDAAEDCKEYQEIDCPYPYFPCNVTGCQVDIIPTPAWCHDFVCWKIPGPGPIPPPSPSPMTPSTIMAIVCGIVGFFGLVSCITAAIIYRESPCCISTFGCLKRAAIKIGHGFEWFGWLLYVIFLCLFVAPFAGLWMLLRNSVNYVYDRIRYRNQ